MPADESTRPTDLPSLYHEHQWPVASELHAAPAAVGGPMDAVVANLATISGADFGLNARSHSTAR